MGSHLHADGKGTDCALPQAPLYVCLTEALGLQFKSLFIDSYKGESELVTCLHSTKSIRVKGTTAERPLPRCGPAGLEGHAGASPAPTDTCGHCSSPMGLEQGPQLAGPCTPGPWLGTSEARKSSPGWANGWLLSSLSRDSPSRTRFMGRLREGESGSCKVLLGIPNHPPLAPTLMLPFTFKRAPFLLCTYPIILSNPVSTSRIQIRAPTAEVPAHPGGRGGACSGSPQGALLPSLALGQAPRTPAAWLPSCQGRRVQLSCLGPARFLRVRFADIVHGPLFISSFVLSTCCV